ncbi:hypothetical protein FRB95_008637 [Tulasnella sp. JGI-2019a]|nr:hypothetical protein FRB95_008637 [Tulasnella sp. JGI-2019a]
MASPSPSSTQSSPKVTTEASLQADDISKEAESRASENSSESKDASDTQDTTATAPAEGQEGGVAKEDEELAAVQDSTSQPPLPQNEWQAVWSPPYNAYYFVNSRTQETTWINPLQPPADNETNQSPSLKDDTTSTPGASTSTSAPIEEQHAAVLPTGQLIDTAALNGIDPALAYLDPTLYAAKTTGAPGQSFTAKFNARTGRFSTDARDPSHLSEAERAKRMSSVYFDVEKWEDEVAARKAAEAKAALEAENAGEKRKRPTKQDLERFKEQKKQKKIAKQAWLRN